MMTPKSKFEVLCRTCLSFEHKLYSVFESQLEDIPLETKLSAVTGLKFLPEDGLPNKICIICKEKAEEAFKFKEKSYSADLTLRNIIKSENDCIESTAQLEKLIVKKENDEEDNGADFDNYYSLVGLPAVGDDFNEIDSAEKVKNEIPVIEAGKFPDITKGGDVKVESGDGSNILNFCTECEAADNNDEKSHKWSCIHSPTGPTNKRKSKPISTIRKSQKALKKNPHKVAEKVHCIICNQKFRSKEDFSDHMPSHRDTIMLNCSYCSKCFLNEEFLKEHLCVMKKEKLGKDEDHNVPIPGSIDRNVKEIKFKELLGLKCDLVLASIRSCGVCKSLYFTEDDLIGHYDAEHPELSQRCNFCTKVFASLKTAARHRRTCKHREKKYTCSTCGLKFINEKSLNKHILRYHEGQDVSIKFMDTKFIETQYQCDTCGKCFYRKELLIKHTRIHMPNAGIHECDVCKKKFHRRDHLRSHLRVHELHRERPDNCLCLYCGRSFSNSSNLIVHMRRHTGEKPYKCDFCGKGFPRSSDLQCHRRSHTGEKPFACHVCGKGFSRSNKLSRHMRVHTGQKPYKCTYCDKAFSQSNDLTLHIRRHTGDKPYICEVCGDRFIQGTALQNHKRVHGHFTEAQSQISELAGSY